ncbi:MAG: ATP-binding cassette domain-containing protein [Eubacteriales bacterium]|nr:ATP-binding cassette domain-containing protein [Eubacteriales bacterium]
MLDISALNVVFNRGTVNEKQVLDDVTMHLDKGDFVTIIGGNGAGKSTLLNCVSGSIRPTSGSISIDGKNITNLPEHKRAAFLGRVFQDPLMGTAGDMWLEENMAMAYRRDKRRTLAMGIKPKERAFYIEQLKILDLGLETRLQTSVKLLSGGQRQALTLLMATMKNPKVLLLDEHTAALDPKTAAKVLKLSDKLISENNLTTLMVTHNMRDAIAHGNRLIMMQGGHIVLDIKGEQKRQLTVESLLDMFAKRSGTNEVSDKLVL